MAYPISISISDNKVSIIKVNRRGVIIKYGTAEAPPIPRSPDAEYTKALAQSIRKASRMARISRGVNVAVAASISTPDIVMNNFTWPDMPHAAIMENAKNEIVAYLYDSPSKFIIGAEIEARKQTEHTNIEGETIASQNIDVLVAAVPTDIAIAVYSGLRIAGYKLSRLDVRQNGWTKVIKKYHSTIVTGDINNFALLYRQSNGQFNMSLFLNKTYYSAHYFDPTEDYESFSLEISAIFDYIQYKEVNASMEAILLLGEDEQEELQNRIGSQLSVPVFTTDEWLKKSMVPTRRRKAVDMSIYIDAFAATLPSSIVPQKQVLNIKTPAQVASVARKKAAAKYTAYAVLLSIIAFAAIFIPHFIQSDLEGRYAELQARLDQFPVSVAEIAALTQQNNLLQSRLDTIQHFYTYAPQAHQMLPVLFDMDFESRLINADGHTINLEGRTTDFYTTGQHFATLQDHPLILYARIETAFEYANGTVFDVVITTVEGSGEYEQTN